MREHIEKLTRKLRGMITRGIVDSRSNDGTYQVQWAGDRASAGVEMLEPQGLHFRAPADADGVTVAPFGDRSAAVMLCASGPTPSTAVAAGEGGLHYVGTFKVFLKSDGTVVLGGATPNDAVALASGTQSVINFFDTLFRGAALPTPGGGAAIQAAWVAAFPVSAPNATSAKVLVEE